MTKLNLLSVRPEKKYFGIVIRPAKYGVGRISSFSSFCEPRGVSNPCGRMAPLNLTYIRAPTPKTHQGSFPDGTSTRGRASWRDRG